MHHLAKVAYGFRRTAGSNPAPLRQFRFRRARVRRACRGGGLKALRAVDCRSSLRRSALGITAGARARHATLTVDDSDPPDTRILIDGTESLGASAPSRSAATLLRRGARRGGAAAGSSSRTPRARAVREAGRARATPITTVAVSVRPVRSSWPHYPWRDTGHPGRAENRAA